MMVTIGRPNPASHGDLAVIAWQIGLQTGLPTMVQSTFGEGKTQTLHMFGRIHQRYSEVVIASLYDVQDFLGYPSEQPDGDMAFRPAPFLKRLRNAGRRGEPCILGLDEITTAAPEVQKALLRGLNEGIFGETPLPPGTWIALAGNPADIATDGSPLTGAFMNRIIQFDFATSDEDWLVQRTIGFPDVLPTVLPATWRADHLPAQMLATTDFLAAKPSLIRDVPKTEAGRSQPFATRRSWDSVALALAACASVGYQHSDSIAALLVDGLVGKRCGDQLRVYLTMRDLPNPAEALANPDAFVLPTRGDRILVAPTSITAYVEEARQRALLTGEAAEWRDRWQRAPRLFARVGRQGDRSLVALAVRPLLRQQPHGERPPAELAEFLPLLHQAGVDQTVPVLARMR